MVDLLEPLVMPPVADAPVRPNVDSTHACVSKVVALANIVVVFPTVLMMFMISNSSPVCKPEA